ncbi:MAG: MBL fold metallo-hydrolase, partial [Phycisphaerae bacterium]|nr:MBL fold metallo-hydrolase [Phycisphaerae bacterium]
MHLSFLGAAGQVTGSRFLVETDEATILVDCGMFQERSFLARNWEPSPVPPEAIDAVLLTHAHLDHCGLLPRLVADGFRGPIYATPPSIDLARIVLEDAGRIQEEDAAYKRRRHKREGRRGPHPEVPLYTAKEATEALRGFRITTFDRPLALPGGLEARYVDAGHILGAAMIVLTVPCGRETRRLVFSGDIGDWERPLMHDPT